MPSHFQFVYLNLILADEVVLNCLSDGNSCLQDAFLSRLMETGATESCSTNDSPDQMEEDRPTACGTTKNIYSNIVSAINDLWCLKNGLHAAVLEALPEGGKKLGLQMFLMLSIHLLCVFLHFLLYCSFFL